MTKNIKIIGSINIITKILICGLVIAGFNNSTANAQTSPAIKVLGFTQPSDSVELNTNQLSWDIEFTEDVRNFNDENISNVEIVDRKNNEIIRPINNTAGIPTRRILNIIPHTDPNMAARKYNITFNNFPALSGKFILRLATNNNITNNNGNTLIITDENRNQQERRFTILNRLTLNYLQLEETQCFENEPNPNAQQLIERRTAKWRVQFSHPIENIDTKSFGIFTANNQINPARYTASISQTSNTQNLENTPSEYTVTFVLNEGDPILTARIPFELRITDSQYPLYIKNAPRADEYKLQDNFVLPINLVEDYQIEHREFNCPGNDSLRINSLERTSPIVNNVTTSPALKWRIEFSQKVNGFGHEDICVKSNPVIAQNVRDNLNFSINEDSNNPEQGPDNPYFRIIGVSGYGEYDGDLELVLKLDHGITDPAGNAPEPIMTNVPDPCNPDNTNPRTSTLLPIVDDAERTYSVQRQMPQVIRILREPANVEQILVDGDEVKWRVVFSTPILNFTPDDLNVPQINNEKIRIENEDNNTLEHDYVVSVNTPNGEQSFGGFNGDVTLEFNSNDIVNENEVALSNILPSGEDNQSYTLGTTPRVTEISRRNPAQENAGEAASLEWNVVFSEDVLVRNFTPEDNLNVILNPERQEVVDDIQLSVRVNPDNPAVNGIATDFIVTANNIQETGYDGLIRISFKTSGIIIRGATAIRDGLSDTGEAMAEVSGFRVTAGPKIVSVTREQPTGEMADEIPHIIWNIEFSEPVDIDTRHIRITQNDDTTLPNITTIQNVNGSNVYRIIVKPIGGYEGLVNITLADETQRTQLGLNRPIRDEGGRDISNNIAPDAPQFRISAAPKIIALEQLTGEILDDNTSPITGNISLLVTESRVIVARWRVVFSEPINLTNLTQTQRNNLFTATSRRSNGLVYPNIPVVLTEDTNTTEENNDYILSYATPTTQIDRPEEMRLDISYDPVIVDNNGNELIGGFPSLGAQIYNVNPIFVGQLTRSEPSDQNAAERDFVEWKIAFPQEIENIDATDFEVYFDESVTKLGQSLSIPDNAIIEEPIKEENSNNYTIRWRWNEETFIGAVNLRYSSSNNISSVDGRSINNGLGNVPSYFEIVNLTRLVSVTPGAISATSSPNFSSRVSWIVEYSRPVRNLRLRAENETTGNFEIRTQTPSDQIVLQSSLVEMHDGIVTQNGRQYATRWRISTEILDSVHEDFTVFMLSQRPEDRNVEDRIFDINEFLIELPVDTPYTLPVALAPHVGKIERQEILSGEATPFGEVVAAKDMSWKITFSEDINNFTAQDIEIFVQGGHDINGQISVTPEPANSKNTFLVSFTNYQESLARLSTASPTNENPYSVSLRIKTDNNIIDENNLGLGNITTPRDTQSPFLVFPILQIDSVTRIQAVNAQRWVVTFNRNLSFSSFSRKGPYRMSLTGLPSNITTPPSEAIPFSLQRILTGGFAPRQILINVEGDRQFPSGTISYYPTVNGYFSNQSTTILKLDIDPDRDNSGSESGLITAANSKIQLPRNPIQPPDNQNENEITLAAKPELTAVSLPRIIGNAGEPLYSYNNFTNGLRSVLFTFDFTEPVDATISDFFFEFRDSNNSRIAQHTEFMQEMRDGVILRRSIGEENRWVLVFPYDLFIGFKGTLEVGLAQRNNIRNRTNIELRPTVLDDADNENSVVIDFGPSIIKFTRVTPTQSISKFSTFSPGNENVGLIVVEEARAEVTLEWDVTFDREVENVGVNDFLVIESERRFDKRSQLDIVNVMPSPTLEENTFRVTARRSASENRIFLPGYISINVLNERTINSVGTCIPPTRTTPEICGGGRQLFGDIRQIFGENHQYFAVVKGRISEINPTPPEGNNLNPKMRILDLDAATIQDRTISWDLRFEGNVILDRARPNTFVVVDEFGEIAQGVRVDQSYTTDATTQQQRVTAIIEPGFTGGNLKLALARSLPLPEDIVTAESTILNIVDDSPAFDVTDIIPLRTESASGIFARQPTLAISRIMPNQDANLFDINVVPKITDITLLEINDNPTTEVDQLNWSVTFTEPMRSADGTPLSEDDFEPVEAGTLQVQYDENENIAFVSVVDLGPYDGPITLKINPTITDVEGAILANPDFKTNRAILDSGSNYNDRIRVFNSPTATVTQNDGTNGVVRNNNPEIRWTIDFNEDVWTRNSSRVTVDIDDVYTVNRLPQGAIVTKEIISQRQHRVTVTNLTEENSQFNGVIVLEIEKEFIRDETNGLYSLYANRPVKNIVGDLSYSVVSSVVIDSIETLQGETPITDTIRAIDENNPPTWKITFNEPIQNINNTHISISGMPTLPLGLGFNIIHNENTNVVRIVPTNYQGYDGTMTIQMLNTENDILSTNDNLPVNLSIPPTSGTNETTMQFSLKPEVKSITSIHSRNQNTIEWTITFDEKVNGVITPDDFPITMIPPIDANMFTRTDNPSTVSPNRIWMTRITLPPLYAGTITLNVDKNVGDITDQSNDNNILKTIDINGEQDQRQVIVPNLAPILTSIESTHSSIVNGNDATWKLVFSEAVQGLEMDDVIVRFDETNINNVAEYIPISLAENPDDDTEWFYTMRVTRGFVGVGNARISVVDVGHNITDQNETPIRLAEARPISENVQINPQPQMLQITRGDPNSEIVNNQDSVTWNVEFSEMITPSVTTPDAQSIYSITLGGNPLVLSDDVRFNVEQIPSNTNQFIYTVTLAYDNSMDGNVVISSNPNNPIVDNTGLTLSDIAPDPNHNRFILANGPIATITREATFADGKIQRFRADEEGNINGGEGTITGGDPNTIGTNPSLKWIVEYNEDVSFDENAYRIQINNTTDILPNATANVTQDNIRQHSIVVQDFGEFQESMQLLINTANIADTSSDQNIIDITKTETKANNINYNNFNVDTQMPTLVQITRGGRDSQTSDNNLIWILQFDEPVRGLNPQDFKVMEGEIEIGAFINQDDVRLDNNNRNNWVVEARVTQTYSGRKILGLVINDTHNIIDASHSQNRLGNTIPQSETYNLNVAPRIDSFEQMSPNGFTDARGFNEVQWKVNFSDTIRNGDINENDFKVTDTQNRNVQLQTSHTDGDRFALVTVDTRTLGDDVITLELSDNPTIEDGETNGSLPLVNRTPVNVGNNQFRIGTAPTIGLARITDFNNGNPINDNEIQWQTMFSEGVLTFDKTNFTIVATPDTFSGDVEIVQDTSANNNNRIWNVVVNNFGEYDGDIRLTLDNPNSIQLLDGTPFAGNLSDAQSNNNNFIVDTQKPRIENITRNEYTLNDDSAGWDVVFSEEVNISAGDVNIIGTPTDNSKSDITISDANISLANNGNTITIVATGYNEFDGTLTLSFNHSDIHDISFGANPLGNELAQTTPTTNENTIIVGTQPRITQILRNVPAPANGDNAVGADNVQWEITFSENVTNFNENFVEIDGIDNNNININVQGTGSVYTVTVSQFGTHDGRLTLGVVSENVNPIVDTAGVALNTNSNISPNEQTYTIGTRPTISDITRHSPTTENAEDRISVTWRVQFSEGVRNFNDDEVNVGSVSEIANDLYEVIVNNIADDDDTLTLNINTGDIEDLNGNAIGNTTPTNINNNTFNVGARPTIEQITRASPANENLPTNGSNADFGIARWEVQFSENNVTLNKNDVNIILNDNGTLQNVEDDDITLEVNGQVHTIAVNISDDITYPNIDGTMTLAVNNAVDASGKELRVTIPTPNQNVFNIGRSPTVESIELFTTITQDEMDNGIKQARELEFRIRFSEQVNNFRTEQLQLYLAEGGINQTKELINTARFDNLQTSDNQTFQFRLSEYDGITNRINNDKFIFIRLGGNANAITDTNGNPIFNIDAESNGLKVRSTTHLVSITRALPTSLRINPIVNPTFHFLLRFNHPVAALANGMGTGTMLGIEDLVITQYSPTGESRTDNSGFQNISFSSITQGSTPTSTEWTMIMTPEISNNITLGGSIQIELADNAIIQSTGPNGQFNLAEPIRLGQNPNDNTFFWREAPRLEEITRALETGQDERIVGENETINWNFKFDSNVELTPSDIEISFTNINDNPSTIIIDPRIEQRIRNSITTNTQDNGRNWNVRITEYKGFNGRIYTEIADGHNINVNGLTLKNKNPITTNNLNFFIVDTPPLILELIRLKNEDLRHLDFIEQVQELTWVVAFSEAINEGNEFVNIINALNVNLNENTEINITKATDETKIQQQLSADTLDVYQIAVRSRAANPLNDGEIILTYDVGSIEDEDFEAETLVGTTPLLGEYQNTYQFVTQPRVISINRSSGFERYTQGTEISWVITFSENVTIPIDEDFNIEVTGQTLVDFNVRLFANSRNVSNAYLIIANTTDTYIGEKTIAVSLNNTNSIRDLATQPQTVYPIHPDSEIFELNVPPQLLSINRSNPLEENVNDINKVQWEAIFSEPITRNRENGLLNDDFDKNINVGNLNVRHNNGENNATITMNNYDGFDGLAQIQLDATKLGLIMGDGIGNINNIVLTPNNANLNAEQFNINTRPIPTVVRTTSNDGTITINNPTLVWEINFNEEIVFNENAYSITGAPNTTQINAEEISNTQHRVTATEIGIFDGVIGLMMQTNLIHDGDDTTLGNITMPLTQSQTIYTSNVPPEIISVTRVTQNRQNTVTDNFIEWKIMFNEPVSGIKNSNVSVTPTANRTGQPTPILNGVINPSDPTTVASLWTVTTNQFNQYEGDVTLAIVNINEIMDRASNSLVNAAPVIGGINEAVVSVDNRQPIINSITRNGGEETVVRVDDQTEIQWDIIFDENIPVGNFPKDAIDITNAAGTSVSQNDFEINGNNRSYSVVVNNLTTDDDTLTLAITNTLIEDEFGNILSATTPTTNENTFNVRTRPRVESITRKTPLDNINGLTHSFVEWNVVFNENVLAVSGDMIDGFGLEVVKKSVSNTPVIASVNGSGQNYVVRVEGLSDFDGIITLIINNPNNIIDETGGVTLENITPIGANDNSFEFNRAPTITGLVRTTPNVEDAGNAEAVVWTIDFSENVTIGNGGFIVTRNGGGDIIPEINPASGTHRQFTITANGYDGYDGELELAINNRENIKDNNNNGLNAMSNLPTNTNTFYVDRDNPTVNSVSRTNPIIQNARNAMEVEWTIRFSEPVRLVDTDLFVTGPSNSQIDASPDSGFNMEYNITISQYGEYDGDITLGIDDTNVVDGYGNRLENDLTSGDNVFTVDTIEPNITGLVRTTPTEQNAGNAEAVVWTIDFSENVTIGNGGLIVTRNSGGDIIPDINPASGAHRQFTITTTGYEGFEGTLTLNLVNNLVQDESNNDVTGILPDANTYIVDRAKPREVTIDTLSSIETLSPLISASGFPIALRWQITFTEIIRDFTSSDVDISLFPIADESIILNVLETAPTNIYTVTATNLPKYTGDIILRISSATDAKDQAGNRLEQPTIRSAQSIDTDPLLINSLTQVNPDRENAKGLNSMQWNITFTKEVDNVSDDGTDFILTGNPTFTTQPTLSVAQVPNSNTYSVSVTNINDYEGNITLLLNGNNDIDEAASTNNPLPDTDLNPFDNTFTVDTLAPTVNGLRRKTPDNDNNILNDNSVEWEITFSEDIGNSLTGSDLTILEVPNANINVLNDSTTIKTINVSGYENYEGTITLQLRNEHEIRDATGTTQIGNRLDTAYRFTGDNTFNVDTMRPTITLVTPRETGNVGNVAEVVWEVTFSEEVNVRTRGQIISTTNNPFNITNGRVTEITQNGNIYTITAEPNINTQGEIRLNLNSNHGIIDVAGNALRGGLSTGGGGGGGGGGVVPPIFVDNLVPTIIEIRRENPQSERIRTGTTQVKWTITFSEPVYGFDDGDIAMTPNPAFNMNFNLVDDSDRTRWVVTLNDIPDQYVGTIIMKVKAIGHRIFDDANNNMIENFPQPQINENTFNIVNQIASVTPQETQDIIASYTANKAKQILNAEPNLNRGNELDIDINNQALNLELAFNNQYFIKEYNKIWINANMIYSKNDDRKSDSSIINIGYDHIYNDRTNMGITMQIDDTTDVGVYNGNQYKINGTGWMIGPYIRKNPANGLYIDARTAYGESQNDIKFNDDPYERFYTERFMFKSKIEGKTEINKWTFNPHITIQSFREKQKEFDNIDQTTIPEQTYNLNRVSIGPKFYKEYIYEKTYITPAIDVLAIHESENMKSENTKYRKNSITKMQIKPGIRVHRANGTSISLQGFSNVYSNDNDKSYGIQFDINLPF